LTACLPAYVIERLFWEQRGMTVEDVVYAEIVFALTMVVLEVPFGLVADRLGRKISFVTGVLFETLSFWILLQAYELSSFLLAMVLAGIGSAAVSGAEEALIYETMKQLLQKERFEKTISRLNATSLAAAGVAALIGAWLATSYELTVHYDLSLGCLMLAFFASCLLIEPDTSGRTVVPVTRRDRCRWQVFPSFARITLFSISFGTTITFLDEFWQLYVRDREIAVSWFGTILIGLMVAQALGNLLPKPNRPFVPLSVLLLVYAGGFILLSLIDSPWSVLVLFGLFLIYGWSEPVLTTWLQGNLTDDSRATGSSMVSMLESLVTIGVGLGFGQISQDAGLDGAYFYLGLVCGAIGAGLLIRYRKSRNV